MCSNWRPGAEPFLAHRGGVSVVFEDDLGVQATFDFVAHRVALPIWEIGRVHDHSGNHIDKARYANSNAQQRAGALILAAQ